MKRSVVLSLQPAQFQAATFKGDLATNLDTIASIGYQGVELAIRDPKLVDLSSLDQVIQKCHLSVPAIGTGQAWGEEGLSFTDPNPAIRQQAIERIVSHIPLASHFGAIVIIGLIRGTIKPRVTADQAMAWFIDAMKEVGTVARSKGVRLAVEPINRNETKLINTVSDGLQLIHSIQMGNIGLLLDTYHMNLEENDLLESIRGCNRHIIHFHVADSNRMYPGAGELDFGKILSTLHSIGYKDWVSGEFLPQPDAETAARKSLTTLDHYLS